MCVCLGAILSAADVEPTHSRRLDIQHTERIHAKGADQRPEIGRIELLGQSEMQEEAGRRRK